MNENLLLFKNLETSNERAHFLFQIAAHVKMLRSRLVYARHTGVFDRNSLWDILRELHEIFHLRYQCIETILEDDKKLSDQHALEYMLLAVSIFEVLPYLDEIPYRAKAIIQLNKLNYRHPPLLSMFTVIWTRDHDKMSTRDQMLWRTVTAADKNPWLHFYARALIEPSEHHASDENKAIILTSSQQNALDDLCNLYRAKVHRITAAGITPSTHALIIGSSGSGKSFVARAFARKYRLSIFEISLGSFIVYGSRSELPTLKRLAIWLRQQQKGFGTTIFIDEIQRLRPKAENSEYTRYIIDEFMSLLDGRVEHLEGWDKETARLLKKSFLTCAGAFQEIYNDKLGNEKIHFVEQWEELSIRDKIFENNWLPEELLFRLSSRLIEIKPPSVDEIAERLHSIHNDLKLPPLTASDAQQKAQSLLRGKKNMRGLEEYIIDQWIARENKQISNSDKQEPPSQKDSPQK